MEGEFQDILYQKHHRVKGAAWITINRPEVRNAFRDQTLREMAKAVEDAVTDPQVGVIVITGAGDKAFCAGADVQWLRESQSKSSTGRLELDAHAGLDRCLKPVIARVNGFAIGGGHHMAYFCDFTIAAEHAVFGQVGPRVSSPATGLTVAYLTLVVGAKRAREVWMLARRFTAAQALQMGLVNRVVPVDRLDDEVDQWCREILALSPACLRMLKASFLSMVQSFAGSFRRDWVGEFAPNFYESGEGNEGKNAFLESRAPDFSKFSRATGYFEPWER